MGQARSFLTLGGSFFLGSAGWVAGGALRDRSCARRERWDRGSFRAFARGGSGCRRSYARSGPIPLPPRGVVWGRWVDFEKEFKKGDDGLRCR